MITKQHDVKILEHQPGNLSNYIWFIECSCGFQARVGTEKAAKSQFDSHRVYHGLQAYYANLEKEEVKEENKKPEVKNQWPLIQKKV